jgi:hypothetical protein
LVEKATVRNEMEAEAIAEERRFIEIESIEARILSRWLRERGDTGGDKAIEFVAKDGLAGNAMATTIMRKVYTRWLAENHEKPTPENIEVRLIDFYTTLTKAFERAGIV